MHTCVARQPIFDTNHTTIGYELLFRGGTGNAFPEIDGSTASCSVITDAFCTLGIDVLTGGRRAFINFTRHLLLEDYALLLPKGVVVVEILEDVKPDPEVVEAVRRCKDAGYSVAIDDFLGSDLQEAFFPYADILKVDFMNTDRSTQRAIAERFRSRGVRLLAEKVEAQEEYEAAVDLGYTLFQGFFFCKPRIMEKPVMPESKVSRLRLLQAVHRPEADFEYVERIVRDDPSVGYRLLGYLNSAYFGLRHEIQNLRQALVILGWRNLRKWASLIALACLGENKPSELVALSVCRARCCERLADAAGLADRADDLFLAGLLSTLDALLDLPMDQALEKIPLASELREALLGKQNTIGRILAAVKVYEQGDWDRLDRLAEQMGIFPEHVAELHLEAVRQASELLPAIQGTPTA